MKFDLLNVERCVERACVPTGFFCVINLILLTPPPPLLDACHAGLRIRKLTAIQFSTSSPLLLLVRGLYMVEIGILWVEKREKEKNRTGRKKRIRRGKKKIRIFLGHSKNLIMIHFQMFSLIFVGDVAQVVERSLSMREALGSMPSFSNFF